MLPLTSAGPVYLLQRLLQDLGIFVHSKDLHSIQEPVVPAETSLTSDVTVPSAQKGKGCNDLSYKKVMMNSKMSTVFHLMINFQIGHEIGAHQ